MLLLISGIAWLGGCKQKPSSEAKGEELLFEVYIQNAIRTRETRTLEASLHYIDSAFATMETNNPRVLAKLYAYKSDYYANRVRQLDTALIYTDSILYIGKKYDWEENNPGELALGYYSKGDVLMKMGRYDESYKNYFKANELGITSIDSCSLSDFSYRLGMVLYKQERFAEAGRYFIDSYHGSLQCAQNFVTFYRQQELLSNAALCFSAANKPDSAMVYYDKALQLINENGKRYPERPALIEVAKGVIYGNQATILKQQNKLPEAEVLLKKSIQINTNPNQGDFIDAEFSMLKLAEIYQEQERWEELENLIRQVETLQQNYPNLEVKAGIHELRWKVNDHNGKLAEAYREFNAYINLRDSIMKVKRAIMDTDARERFRNIGKQYEIDVLKKNNELQQLYLVLSVVGIGLVGVIIALVYFNWRKSRKLVHELTLANEQVNAQKHQLEDALQTLQEQQKEKDRILRVVAHDLRNPIGGMTGFTEMMLMEGNINEEQRQILSLLQQAGKDALQLISEILSSSKEEGPLIKAPADMAQLISDCIGLLRFKAEEKQQQIDVSLPPVPVILQVNREKMTRVINNIITNAIKFSPIRSVIYIRLELLQEQALISITDSGIGIPEDILPQVFDMHTSAKRTGTAGEKPFGLGLSISRQIVERHGGKIWIESRTGTGTTVYVSLPVTKY